MPVPRRILSSIVVVLAALAPAAYAQPPAERAAEVNGTPIMAADVDAKLGSTLARLQEQMFELRRQQLDALIDEKLLEAEAAKRGVSVAALVNAEITSKVTPATAADAAAFYEQNKARVQGDYKSLEAQITSYLTGQRTQARQQEFLNTLRSAAKIEVFLPRPPIFRSDVSTAGAPVRGRQDAPVTIVEFSDFHCPFCRRAQPIIDQVRAKYGDKVKLVYRDFPLDTLHPQARATAEAARCADEQGKFWEFHDKVFANEPDGTPAALDRFARESGMNVAAFQACRASGKYTQPVQASDEEGARLGITGTPTFFINGRPLVGAQPLDAFTKVIDEELALAAQNRAPASR